MPNGDYFLNQLMFNGQGPLPTKCDMLGHKHRLASAVRSDETATFRCARCGEVEHLPVIREDARIARDTRTYCEAFGLQVPAFARTTVTEDTP